ncbi:hypothetical protein BCF55_1086 [Hydrogenivirga caldilitoris]|uniref:Uncharacterized protein n=1 Tax=Hydrogenivirga caldilitoris TaxID=246264 RepID=A0A497XVH6_9AQUI|nr:hypothetical protein [Hydrogenivirga caldilitoris]RLJ70803.1 hypothetical protein BCF55_1086 [Hydrogenivirga caldilitoris]
MSRYLSRRVVYLFSVGLLVLILGYSFTSLSELRDRVTHEYFKHKEFLLDLKLAKEVKKSTPTESSLRELLGSMRVNIESVYASEGGIEVRFETDWRRLPQLIKELESRYRIVNFSAVDNTGKGFFKARVVVR